MSPTGAPLPWALRRASTHSHDACELSHSAHLLAFARTLSDAGRCRALRASQAFRPIIRTHKKVIALVCSLLHGYIKCRYDPRSGRVGFSPLGLPTERERAGRVVFLHDLPAGGHGRPHALPIAAGSHAHAPPRRSRTLFSRLCTPTTAHMGVPVADLGGAAGPHVHRTRRWHQ